MKWDWQYFQEGEVIFKKNTGVGLPEVSKLIDLGINKSRGHQRKQRKKMLDELYSQSSGCTNINQIGNTDFFLANCVNKRFINAA